MPGGFRTSTDLVNEALAKLGVLAAGQPTDPEDFNYVSEILDAVLRKLSAHGVVNIADKDNIRGEYFSDLADILAGECASKFGAELDDLSVLIGRGWGNNGDGAAAKSLRTIARKFPTYEAVKAIYF